MKDECAPRFKDEKLAVHWQVDDTKESFERLIHHLDVTSNFKPYFEEALRNLGLSSNEYGDGLVIADIGAGVCWTSAIMAKHPKVRLVYGVDPSSNRLNHAGFIKKHFGVDKKVKVTYGSFSEPNVPEKVDIVVLCGSLHHCFDEHLDGLFSNIKGILKPRGKVLIANEHYVDMLWSAKRILSYSKHFGSRKELFFYTLRRPRTPHPTDGEHWRTRRELEKIFDRYGFKYRFYLHKGDLCKNKKDLLSKIGWHYYNAVLTER
ncbi:MAG: class I SAM-dependent methyltransferase [Candidatus Omnitrophica bacterium]|nr:class I SAM-dependent methyltransferase [Candidatus Omnitrophota bacterium]MDD5736843.1 class I SAM-dependent methyltransferase [Candidatus Omnitrophota bacterium]